MSSTFGFLHDFIELVGPRGKADLASLYAAHSSLKWPLPVFDDNFRYNTSSASTAIWYDSSDVPVRVGQEADFKTRRIGRFSCGSFFDVFICITLMRLFFI